MSEIMLTPEGAKVLRAMIVSCGTAGCFLAIKRLEGVRSDISLASVGMDDDHWLMAAFSRLKDFAVAEKINTLDTYEVARYFGGVMHIDIMARIADHAGMGQYLGPHVGLASHVLMPLSDGKYQNAGREIIFGNYIELNPEEEGISCYHLGVVVKIPLSQQEVRAILDEQSTSKEFMSALDKIKNPITPPPEYFQALSCTVQKAKST